MAVIKRHLRPGACAALHVATERSLRDARAVDVRPVLDAPYDADGQRLQIYLPLVEFDEAAGRFDQLTEYVLVAADGATKRRSAERLTYYVSDLAADAAAAGLQLDRDPRPFGVDGEMFTFRNA